MATNDSEPTRTGAQPAPPEPGTASIDSSGSSLSRSLAAELVMKPSSWLAYINACCISEKCISDCTLQAGTTLELVATTALKIGKAKNAQFAVRYAKHIMTNAEWDSIAITAAANTIDMSKLEAVVARPPSSPDPPNAVNDKFHAIFTDLCEKEVGMPGAGALFGAPVVHASSIGATAGVQHWTPPLPPSLQSSWK